MADELNTGTATSEVVAPQPTQVDIPGETPEQKYQRLYIQPQPQGTSTSGDTSVSAAMAQVAAELAALRTAQTQRPVSTGVEPQVSKLEWVQKIQKGDFEGAQSSLAQSVRAELSPQLDQVRQQAYSDAMQAAWVNNEVEKYKGEVRVANPDLVPFEQYMQGAVVERLRLAQAAGRVANPAQFISEYRTAVQDEVSKMRNVVLSIRGQGKDEALLRSQQVLSSPTLSPQQVQSTQSQQLSQGSPTGESDNDYFARRRSEENRRRGLG